MTVTKKKKKRFKSTAPAKKKRKRAPAAAIFDAMAGDGRDVQRVVTHAVAEGIMTARHATAVFHVAPCGHSDCAECPELAEACFNETAARRSDPPT